MTILKHELRLGKNSFFIWTASIGFLLSVCIFLFPEMKDQMGEIGDMFSSMGAFTEAFGMDRLNFGTLIGYYAIECGNVLGLGGAFYAALCSVSILSKEEKDGTAEFLLTHPVTRTRVVSEKLIAVLVEITAMNILILCLSLASIALIGESIPLKEVLLLHLAYYLLQIELSAVCLAVSAFVKRSSVGIGLGIAVTAYFLSLIANITESARFLKYITPFGYCDAADIVDGGRLDGSMIVIGMLISVLSIAIAYIKYTKKDIR